MTNYVSTLSGAAVEAALVSAANGSARARFSYDQTVPSINESLNVSTVTDSSAGTFVVNYTSAFATADKGGAGFGGQNFALRPQVFGASADTCISYTGTPTATDAKAYGILMGDMA